MKADSASIRDADRLPMQISMVFYPAWRVQAQVQCAWQGQYPEKRAVTKYRNVWVQTGSGLGNGYNKQEAYTDYETVWHPTSGTAFASPDFFVPAAPGVSMPQLQTATQNAGKFSSVDSGPSVSGRFAIARPSLTQARAWQQFDCDAFIEMSARSQCGGPGVIVSHVSQIVVSKTFTLAYFPMAVVSYNVAGGEYRHFVSLLDGNFSGDLPKDLGAIRNEAVAARTTDENFVKTAQRIAWIALCVGLFTLIPLWHWFTSDSSDNSGAELLGECIVCLAGFGTAINRFRAIQDGRHRNWLAFLSRRGPALVRIVLNPPPSLSQLKTAIPSQNLAPLRKAADDNTLEAVMATSAGQAVADAIAQVILTVKQP